MILDMAIRCCIFLPTLLMAFLTGYIKAIVKYLTQDHKQYSLKEIEIMQAVKRSKLILKNGNCLTSDSFAMRKRFFNDKEKGYFCSARLANLKRKQNTPTDELRTMLTNNIIHLLPMIGMAELNNWLFSGYIITRLPFPMTLKFKPMLQRDIDMPLLDASWVSSVSWYFMNIMGFGYLKACVLPESCAQDDEQPEESLLTKEAIKKTWEDMEIYNHRWDLSGCEL